MACSKIKKTVIHPCPTVWMGQEQSDTKAGIATYHGPTKLLTWWYKDQAAQGKFLVDVMPTDSKEAECPTQADCVAVELDPEKYPLHALCFWGCKYAPQHIEVVCGPSSDPNPTIADPNHFTEVFDLHSFYYDTSTNQWSTPAFSFDEVQDDGSGEGANFGWNSIRTTRNNKLSSSDQKVSASDVPDSVKQPWLDYRKKLRDLPADWAGVGTATHLIVWPMEPDLVAAGCTIVGDRSSMYETDPATLNDKFIFKPGEACPDVDLY